MDAQPDKDAGTEGTVAAVGSSGDDVVSPYEQTYEQAMERIAELHRGWAEVVAEVGAVLGDGDPLPPAVQVLAA